MVKICTRVRCLPFLLTVHRFVNAKENYKKLKADTYINTEIFLSYLMVHNCTKTQNTQMHIIICIAEINF